MDGMTLPAQLDELLDDRPADKVFRVDRNIYLDEEIFEAEMRTIFEGNWQFICHESQVRNHGDYFATRLGRQPVFVHRQADGSLKGFLNACSHRAAIVTPLQKGNAKTLTCRFHGWTYKCTGECISIKNEEDGYGPGLDRNNYNLTAIGALASYRGFVFGSIAKDVLPLEDFLGESKAFIDFIADQSADGLEVLPGSQKYVIGGNWKMSTENAVDGYHTSTVHRVFANTVRLREAREGYEGMMKTEVGRLAREVRNGCYDLGQGHMVIWAERDPVSSSPLSEAEARLERDHPAGKVNWMLRRGRNLIVFPSLMINDFAATQIRIFRPISVNETEVTIYCLAPSEESRDARYARLRKFEDFFMASGMATSDDVTALEATHEGSRGRVARWGEFHRGMNTMLQGPDDVAEEGGFVPETSNSSWDHETLYYSFYRTWRKHIERA
ncbi:MAG: Rieske 2Fe-2S domain-containing protein [Rhodospirillaceae bacterium]